MRNNAPVMLALGLGSASHRLTVDRYLTLEIRYGRPAVAYRHRLGAEEEDVEPNKAGRARNPMRFLLLGFILARPRSQVQVESESSRNPIVYWRKREVSVAIPLDILMAFSRRCTAMSLVRYLMSSAA